MNKLKKKVKIIEEWLHYKEVKLNRIQKMK